MGHPRPMNDSHEPDYALATLLGVLALAHGMFLGVVAILKAL